MDGSQVFDRVAAKREPSLRLPHASSPDESSRRTILLLTAILLLAAGLRLFNLGSDSLWHDELWGLEMTVGHDAQQLLLPANGVLTAPPDLLAPDPATPWWRVWTHMHHDTHPPLFHLMLRGWRGWFGSGERALRSMSVLWSMVAILALFDAVRVHNGPRAALWACAIMAVASPQILYAQEARSYAPLLAEGMLALAAITRLERDDGGLRAALLLGGAVCSMALTHYFCAGAVAGLAAYCVFGLRGRARVTAAAAILSAAVLGLALWGEQFLIQRANFRADNALVGWLHDPSTHPAATTAARLLLLPGRFIADASGGFKAASTILASLFVLPLLAGRRSPKVLLWWCWLVGTVAPVAALDWLQHDKHLAMIRYTLLASPAAYVLLATAQDWLPVMLRHVGRAVPAAALIAGIVALPAHAYHPSWRPNWREMAARISTGRTAGEPVCCVGPCADGFWSPDGIYIELNEYLRPLNGPIVLFTDDPAHPSAANGSTLLSPAPSAWAIVSGSGSDAAWPPTGWVIDSSSSYADAGTLEHLHRK